MNATFTLDEAIAIANRVTNRPGSAYIFNGTMFVGCSIREAVMIESLLFDACDGGVIISRSGNESAFDFV